ncbi:hypothetical protein [Streptomyces sp. NPDC001056]
MPPTARRAARSPAFPIQIIPGDRTGPEPEPAAPTIEEAAGPLLVRTSCDAARHQHAAHREFLGERRAA